MGIRSIVEVLDHAPETLSSSERLILVVIAENINDDDPQRLTWPNFDIGVLRKRTGMKGDALQKALERLGVRGLEARIPIGKGKDGRTLYAIPGTQCRFRLPHLLGPNEFGPSEEGPNQFRPEGNQFGPKGRTNSGQKGTSSVQKGTSSAPSPLSSPSEVPPLSSDGGSAPSAHPSPPVDRDEREEDPRGEEDPQPPTPDGEGDGWQRSQTKNAKEKTDPTTRRLADAHGATEDETRSILDDIAREGRITNPGAWARKAPTPDTAPYDDFARRLAVKRHPHSAPAAGSRPCDKTLAEALAAPDGVPRVRDEDTTLRGAAAAREALQALRRPTGRGGDPQTFGALIPSVVGGQHAEGTDGG